jgi:Chain length determinant protein
VPAHRRTTLLRVWGPVLLFVALAVGAAAAYVELAPKDYRATAKVLVTPVADPRYAGLPVLRGTGAVPTAIQLLKTDTLAESVRQQLGLRESSDELLAHVHPTRVGASTVVDVTVKTSPASQAVKIANSFADLLVAERTAALNSKIIDETNREFQELLRLPPKAKAGARGTAVRSRLAALRSLARSTDPSLRVLGHATSAETVRPPALPIILGTLAGALVLGGAAGLLASRRRGVEATSSYDLAVTDQLVAQLEQRLSQRIESLLAEQERLLAKEAELAARERALEGGGSAAPQAAAPDPRRFAELDDREQALDERVKLVTKRELELVRRAGELNRREKELTEREAELEARTAELDTRAKEFDARAEELSRRADELEERSAAAAVAAPPAPAPPPPANVAEFPQRPGRWNLNELARVVEERGPEFPERQEEWQSYLFFLRSYAAPDGTVPASFDWLIEEQFAGIVPATAS